MKKIFVCSPYQPVSESEAGKKAELEENIYRAKMACRLIAACGLMPLATHLYFTAILDDDQKAERERGIQMGLSWLEEAAEVWVFGNRITKGMALEIERAQELSKPVRNMPEPTKLLGMLIKSIAEKYGLSDCKNEEQPDAAESEEDNGE